LMMWMRGRFRDLCQVSRNFLTRMIAITARQQDLAELTGRSKTFYMIEAIRNTWTISKICISSTSA
jgi:hypothetical protein